MRCGGWLTEEVDGQWRAAMAFASELWDSFEVVAKENARGQALSGKVKELLGALAKAESEYAKTLAKVVNDKAFAGAVAFGELQVLFDTVKAETLEAGAAHAALGDQLAALAAHTGDALKDRKKRSKVVRVAVRRSTQFPFPFLFVWLFLLSL